METSALLWKIVFVPLAGSLLIPLFGRVSERVRNIYALALAVAPFIFTLTYIPLVMQGITSTAGKELPFGFDFLLVADGLAVFTALMSSLISSIIVLYSFGYISHYENRNEYYVMVLMFLGAMMGIIFSGNLIYFYTFWEITAFTSWRLIGFFREKYYVERADKAFLVTAFGALAMLIGFVMIYQQTGSFNLSVISANLQFSPLSNAAMLLIMAGILAKSATLPFHTWLPDAGVAPSPVTALLHAAVLVKIGVYAYARLFVVTMPPPEIWNTIVPIIAGTSALVAATAALVDNDLKRIIAYSTVSQIGFIFLGLSVGSPIGFAGALIYILMHGLSKAGLFLAAGIVEQNTHTKDITRLGGLFATMPLTAVSFLFCALSVMGIPPFGGFFNKYMVFAGGIESGRIGITMIFLAGAMLTILYLFRVFYMVFLGDRKGPEAREGSPVMVSCVVLLAVLSLAGGLLIIYPLRFVDAIVKYAGL